MIVSLYFGIVILAALMGSFLSRMHGGGSDYGLPILKQINQYSLEAFLLSLPILAYAYPTFPIIDCTILLIAYGVHVLGLRTGHGQWMDLGDWKGIIEPEKLDIFVELIFGPDHNEFEEGEGNYWRDFTGLALSGFLPLLPLCLFLLYKSAYLSCAVIAISGILKVSGYAIAKAIGIKKFTVVGEWVRGACLWGGLTIGWLLYV